MSSENGPHRGPPNTGGLLSRIERLSLGSREDRQHSLRLLGQALPESEEPLSDVTQTFELPSDATPTAEQRARYALQIDQIGSYRIIRRIGLGGMGTVYEAEQQTPRRRVALKTIHPWLLSEAMRQRFQLESQVLASLLHPNIPQIYEAGEIGGRLFFAMEHIEGASLSTFLAHASPPTALRLELMSTICEAVHHAHLRGIIHCDLKPANVLVTRAGEPKVLDFGIARLLDSGPHTGDGLIFGTQRYMSPEQRHGGSLDVRSDVYSLGVMLREILPAPDRGPLSGVIDKATASEPAERYRSAEKLAVDLRALLSHHPLSTHPHTAPYLAAKFVRRNPLLVIATATIMLAIFVGSLTSLMMYREARIAWSAEQEQRLVAEQARDAAASEAQSAMETVEFLAATLAQAIPEQSLGKEVTIEDILVRIEQLLAEDPYRDSPKLRIKVRLILAEIELQRGDRERALEHLDHAEQTYRDESPTDSEMVVKLFSLMGRIHRDQWELEEAEADLKQALELGYRIQAPPHEMLLRGHHRYARTLLLLGRLAQAREQFHEAISQIGQLQLTYPSSHSLLATMEGMEGNHAQAYALMETALTLSALTSSEDHPEYINTLFHLGTVNRLSGDLEAARRIYYRALEIYLPIYGAEHPRVHSTRKRIAEVELLSDRLDLAEAQLQAIPIDTTDSRIVILRAELQHARRDLSSARKLTEVALAAPSRQPSWVLAQNQVRAGAVQWDQGEQDTGTALMKQGFTVLCETLGSKSPYTIDAVTLMSERGVTGSAHTGSCP
ncbi:MAG: tetratricopeptide (TPR) repeat protein/predicted Ser/Thr protein kinase [Myxococcota bacterium]|jgi:tetratricopeptide (TPR) repeat protein/predicted Ser/Thr protein kinase